MVNYEPILRFEVYLMRELLLSLLPWGYSVIELVQNFRSPLLDYFFRGVTFLGDAGGYLILFPLIFWCVDARVGRRLAFFVLGSLSVNSTFKYWFAIPRPEDIRVDVLVRETSPSFPSGHAQGTLSFWGYLAWRKKNLYLALLALFLILSIGLSRIYLGVHFPQDVLGGWAIGAVLLALFVWTEEVAIRKLTQLPLYLQLLAASIGPLLLYSTVPHPARIPLLATWWGVSIGLVLEARFVKFRADGTLKQRALRFLLVIPLGALFIGMKLLLPKGELFRAIRYMSAGLGAVFLFPWLMVRFNSRLRLLPDAEDGDQ